MTNAVIKKADLFELLIHSPNHLFPKCFAAIPVGEAEQNDNIAIVVTSHGGHIGFLEGIYPRHRGYMDRLFAQFLSAMIRYDTNNLKRD